MSEKDPQEDSGCSVPVGLEYVILYPSADKGAGIIWEIGCCVRVFDGCAEPPISDHRQVSRFTTWMNWDNLWLDDWLSRRTKALSVSTRHGSQ